MTPESGSKLVVRLDYAVQQYLKVPQSPTQAMAGKLYLQIERMQCAPVQRFAGLCEQPMPQAIREAVQMPELHWRRTQEGRRADLGLKAARHRQAKDQEATAFSDLWSSLYCL